MIKLRLRYDWKSGLWIGVDDGAIYGGRRHAANQSEALSRSLNRLGDG